MAVRHAPILLTLSLVTSLGILTGLAADPPPAGHFTAYLAGENEVPPRDTEAGGIAQFELANDEQSMRYELVVHKIRNVVAAHIHLGPPGVNGPVVLFLYGPVPPGGGPIQGRIARGVITAANLIGPLANHPFSELVAAMRSGNTYVNVHTNDGVAPADTGPGDFPGGEIRGQLVGRP